MLLMMSFIFNLALTFICIGITVDGVVAVEISEIQFQMN